MSRFALTGKKVLVTGATSGIGTAICQGVVELGGELIVTGRNETRLAAAADNFGPMSVGPLIADLTDPNARDSLVKKISSVDGVVHAAGSLVLTPSAFLTVEKLRTVEAINYEAPVLLTAALLKAKKINVGGSIVFVASVAGQVGAKGHVLYSGAKGAVLAASRSLAIELASKRIRVNALAPGMVRSGMARQAADLLGDQAMAGHEKEYPLGFGAPEDVAGPALFLLSDASQWVTGTTLVCDGGFSAR